MNEVIVIGDSTNNTLSVIRSLGQAGVRQTLILKTDDDFCNVTESKYVRHSPLVKIADINELEKVLNSIDADGQLIVCTFDEAAMWADEHEETLSKKFVTPCRGGHIGELFNKEAQCRLAEECGLTVPKSRLFNRGDALSDIDIDFPLLIKPLVSTGGEKSDIHICRNEKDLEKALNHDSSCERFVAQEFIDKEYELDCIGVSTDDEVILSGAVRKIRHYPPLTGAGAYGKFIPISMTDVDVKGVEKFIRRSGYHGPFSVEFLHTKDGKNYFMEVNFRNEGLAYASTCAGANLHAVYVGAERYDASKVKSLYMMNYALDFLYVKSGDLPFRTWLRDFLRTSCFINFSLRDPMPTIKHYLSKFTHATRK